MPAPPTGRFEVPSHGAAPSMDGDMDGDVGDDGAEEVAQEVWRRA
ncbi:hypothetical protein ACFYWS_04770 [Streptomyces sp. NPDC002795]